MIKEFKKAETMETFIKLSIITFGSENGVDLHTQLTEVSNIDFQPLSVHGATPMGTAFEMAKAPNWSQIGMLLLWDMDRKSSV